MPSFVRIVGIVGVGGRNGGDGLSVVVEYGFLCLRVFCLGQRVAVFVDNEVGGGSLFGQPLPRFEAV